MRKLATIEQLITRYPNLFHMAEEGTWPSIQRHGLLSTSALLDLFEITGDRRQSIESEWRPRSVSIEHQEHGTAVIRDQSPMDPYSLVPLLLDGLEPADWYKIINRKTFFWATRDRLNRFLNARPYKGSVHDVVTVDTRSLVDRYEDDITLASFNTGVSAFGPSHQRGLSTFKSIQDYGDDAWGVVELAVDYGVWGLDDLVISVEQWRGSQRLNRIWNR